MTLHEMDQECYKHNGKCDKCKLNCIYDWYETNQLWCLKSIRYDYEKKYRQAIAEGKKEKAEEIAREYASIEQKYLQKEGNK